MHERRCHLAFSSFNTEGKNENTKIGSRKKLILTLKTQTAAQSPAGDSMAANVMKAVKHT
jgi:hypothetical protein